MSAKREGGGGGDGSAKKRKYTQQGHHRGTELGAGMRGALITCDVHVERHAIREAFALLEGLTEPEPGPSAAPAGSESAATAGDELQRELQELQRSQKAGGGGGAREGKRFAVAQTGVGGTVLIRFESSSIDPMALIGRVMDGALASGRNSTPHVVRMLPVQVTCHAKASAIIEAAAPLIGAALSGYKGTYAVNWRRRCNTTIDKMEVIDGLASAVAAAAPEASVDLKHAAAAINVDVIKTTACVSVLPRWREYGAYNVRALAGEEPPPPGPGKAKPEEPSASGGGGGGA